MPRQNLHSHPGDIFIPCPEMFEISKQKTSTERMNDVFSKFFYVTIFSISNSVRKKSYVNAGDKFNIRKKREAKHTCILEWTELEYSPL